LCLLCTVDGILVEDHALELQFPSIHVVVVEGGCVLLAANDMPGIKRRIHVVDAFGFQVELFDIRLGVQFGDGSSLRVNLVKLDIRQRGRDGSGGVRHGHFHVSIDEFQDRLAFFQGVAVLDVYVGYPAPIGRIQIDGVKRHNGTVLGDRFLELIFLDLADGYAVQVNIQLAATPGKIKGREDQQHEGQDPADRH
jgi:hypothetical protein